MQFSRFKSGIPVLLFLSVMTSCSHPAITNSRQDLSLSQGSQHFQQSKTAISGITEFPALNKLAVKAALNDIALYATVSIIDPATNRTIASGLSNETGTFTINPAPSFNPSPASVYFLEAVKRNGGAGNSVTAIKTVIQWNGSNWGSITTPDLKINERTTSLAIIASLNPGFDAAGLIGKLDTNVSPAVFTDYGSPVANQAALDSVLDIVNAAFQNNVDPVQYTRLAQGIYKPVQPPKLSIPIRGNRLIYTSKNTPCCSSQPLTIMMSYPDGSEPSTLISNWQYNVDSGMMGEIPSLMVNSAKTRLIIRATPLVGGTTGFYGMDIAEGAQPAPIATPATLYFANNVSDGPIQKNGIIDGNRLLLHTNQMNNTFYIFDINTETFTPVNLHGINIASYVVKKIGNSYKIIFTNQNGGSIYVKDLADPGPPEKVSGTVAVTEMQTSVSGNKILVRAGSKFYYLNYGGGSRTPVEIGSNETFDGYTELSDTSNKIIMTRNAMGYSAYIIDLTAPTVKTQVNLPVNSYFLSFLINATGTKAYLSRQTAGGMGDRHEMFSVNLADGAATQISNYSGGDINAQYRRHQNPQLSEDGSALVWTYTEMNGSSGSYSTLFRHNTTTGTTDADPTYSNTTTNSVTINNQRNRPLKYVRVYNNFTTVANYYMLNSDLTTGNLFYSTSAYLNLDNPRPSTTYPGKFYTTLGNATSGNYDLVLIDPAGGTLTKITDTTGKDENNFVSLE